MIDALKTLATQVGFITAFIAAVKALTLMH
jgi:hypothetical protein